MFKRLALKKQYLKYIFYLSASRDPARQMHHPPAPEVGSGNAVFEHGFAYARNYSGTLLWQWMRLPGDVVFAIGAQLMA